MRYNRNTSRFVLTVVVDEHGKAAGVVGAFFGAGEHQVNVGVTVRDEALHAVVIRPFGLRLTLAYTAH